MYGRVASPPLHLPAVRPLSREVDDRQGRAPRVRARVLFRDTIGGGLASLSNLEVGCSYRCLGSPFFVCHANGGSPFIFHIQYTHRVVGRDTVSSSTSSMRCGRTTTTSRFSTRALPPPLRDRPRYGRNATAAGILRTRNDITPSLPSFVPFSYPLLITNLIEMPRTVKSLRLRATSLFGRCTTSSTA